MAILKMKKIREMSEKELGERLRELQLELAKERASAVVGGTVKSPGRIREIRRTIARIRTHHTEHQRKVAQAAKPVAKPVAAPARPAAVTQKQKRGGMA